MQGQAPSQMTLLRHGLAMVTQRIGGRYVLSNPYIKHVRVLTLCTRDCR